MIQTLIGKKIEQTQKFLQDGTRIPVTVIDVPDNAVLQVKTVQTDKYKALQIGIGKKKKPVKAALGHVKKAGFGSSVPSFVKEIKLSTGVEGDLPAAGSFLKVDEVFKAGDIVDVTGTSKGKGFAGVMKRHNFGGGPKTHGQSDRSRAPGSIGQTTTPGRVYRGKRMAGRMGSDSVTIKNLEIVDVDSENKKIYVKGLVPGVVNSIVYIVKTGEDKKFVPLYKLEEKKEVIEAVQAEKAEEVMQEDQSAKIKDPKQDKS